MPVTKWLRANSKLVAICVVAIIAVVFLAGMKPTGYVTYFAELNDTKNNLTACLSSVQSCSEQLAGAQFSLSECMDAREKANLSLQVCEAETKEALQNAAAAEQAANERYDLLASNAAHDICCKRGIDVASWSISGDLIVCAGSQSVNCTA